MTDSIHYIYGDDRDSKREVEIEVREAKDLHGLDIEAIGWAPHLLIADVHIPWTSVTFRGPASALHELFMGVGMDLIKSEIEILLPTEEQT